MKLPHRRQFLQVAAGATALPALSRIAQAQVYPARPVRIIVPFPPAGSTDIVGRLIGQWLSERLGQQFIVDNRPGAGTNIGTEAAVRAPADGYTLLIAVPPSAINATLYEKMNFNFLRDLIPVASVLRAPLVMEINPSLSAKTVPEFIAYARTNPGKISMASAGVGSGNHVAGELFKRMAGLDMIHVPYRGTGPALTDLIGGQVQIFFDAIPASLEHIKAGKLRALAVTSATRSEVLPDVPALSAFVPGYEATFWAGFVAPKNTPSGIVEKLNMEINAALADPKIKVRIAELGGSPFPGAPAEFGNFLAEETEKWGKVVKFAGMKSE